MKCLTRSRTPAHKPAEADTSPELKEPKRSAPSSRVPSSISCRHPEATGADNKENREEKPRAGDVLLGEDEEEVGVEGEEDSGYLSLHTSQLEQWDGDCQRVETPERETHTHPHTHAPPHTHARRCGASPPRTDSGSSCLPVLKFQEEVCRQLAKGYEKSQSYDWTLVNKVAERYSLHNVIGSKMGLEHIDLLCALFKKDMKHILTRILGLLRDWDLINCTKVSRTWRKIVHQDKMAVRRCRRAEDMLRVQDSEKCRGSLSRDFRISRVLFSCLQSVASSTHSHKSTKKVRSQTEAAPGRFAEFQEATKSLKGHEALRSCRRCESPARYDPAMKRAVCLRASCAFDFCSLCQSAYHGSARCPTGVVRTSTPQCQAAPLAGSSRSKRSIRRL